ncbi:MAG: hypothetical protein Greene041619_713 [Candidatus Peregrinibacteria bacterium Greene0416_19]|nr:MAG: hypothetical protein Greene041619_713 [Candidatus Peregrinibacteria bacterium Greene0416_19]
MHELLDAVAYLFDVLLMPFTAGSEPRKIWMKVVGAAIAAVGILTLLGLLVWALFVKAQGLRALLAPSAFAMEQNGTLTAGIVGPIADKEPIRAGAWQVPVLTLRLTADCARDADIDWITVVHEGTGDVRDIKGVAAIVVDGKASTSSPVDPRDRTATLHFNDSPLRIPKCQAETVVISANFPVQPTKTGTHAFMVELPSDILGETVVGDFPLRGGTYVLAGRWTKTACLREAWRITKAQDRRQALRACRK